jgi:hypothetical protein
MGYDGHNGQDDGLEWALRVKGNTTKYPVFAWLMSWLLCRLMEWAPSQRFGAASKGPIRSPLVWAAWAEFFIRAALCSLQA